jgi:branched-chain amino acid transport system ATP-binding protein
MLRLEDVTAGYDNTTVLRRITLTVPDSSVVALIGPNGAGKTTLLRVASGLVRPRQGRLVIDGSDLTRCRPHELVSRGICHIPEGRGIFPELTVRDNLVLFSQANEVDGSIARAVDAFPRLGPRLNQQAGTMSGGEQQMVALARSYIAHASVVLLDEVSMGLAPLVVDEIFEFLARLAQGGTAMLLVEQYVTKALALADYVYVLDRGHIGFAGEPAELEGDDVFARYLGVAARS